MCRICPRRSASVQQSLSLSTYLTTLTLIFTSILRHNTATYISGITWAGDRAPSYNSDCLLQPYLNEYAGYYVTEEDTCQYNCSGSLTFSVTVCRALSTLGISSDLHLHPSPRRYQHFGHHVSRGPAAVLAAGESPLYLYKLVFVQQYSTRFPFGGTDVV